MRPVRFPELMNRVRSHEFWAAPFDIRLKTAVWISGVTINVTLISFFFLPQLWSFGGWLLVFRGEYRAVIELVGRLLPTLLLINLTCLIIYVALLIATRGLEEGTPKWHQLSIIPVVLGALNGFVVALELVIVVINIVIIVIIITIAAVVLMAALAGAGRRN